MSGYLPSSRFTNFVRSENILIQSNKALDLSPHSYHSLISTTYSGLAAPQVLSWVPSKVICWTGKEDPIPKDHQDILENYLLHLFKDKADSNPEFLSWAQRQSIVFIYWILMIQIA